MMKKMILPLIAALCGLGPVAAQDLIVKTDSTKLEAKVIEISPDAVRYKRFSNPDGPTYVLPSAQIGYIQYANGERDLFSSSAAATETPAPQATQSIPMTPLVPAEKVAGNPTEPVTVVTEVPKSAPEAIYADQQPVLKKFAIGEYFNYNGIRGVVAVVTDDGQHGLVVSLDEIYLQWSDFRKPNLRLVGADDRIDGSVNMEKVESYIAANKLTWNDFPAFKWCRDKGDGWYLPSIDEMLSIGNNYNGGLRIKYSRAARNRFNDALKENGGKRMDRMVYYFSSTEKNDKEAFTSHMGIEPPYVVEIPKYNKFIVRAVHKF